MKKKKKRIREFTWNDYEISKNLHEELKAFCLQYEEKKSKIKYGLSGVSADGMPHGSSVGSPTEENAISNAIYKRDCEMIEEAADRANKDIAKYIVKSVAYDLPYEYIEYDEQQGKIPVGKTDFYGYRRLFFFYLKKMKLGTT